MNAFKFEIVSYILLELVSNDLKACQSQITYQKTLTLIAIEKVFSYVDLEIMCTVFIALDFDSTNMVYAEVVLLDVNDA